MTPSPEVTIQTQMIYPDNILLLAPELGEQCGVLTGDEAVANLFTHLVQGLINSDAFVTALTTINPEYTSGALQIVQFCLGGAA